MEVGVNTSNLLFTVKIRRKFTIWLMATSSVAAIVRM